MQKHYDKVPTQGSTNPVKSDGLAQQLTQIGSDLDELETTLDGGNIPLSVTWTDGFIWGGGASTNSALQRTELNLTKGQTITFKGGKNSTLDVYALAKKVDTTYTKIQSYAQNAVQETIVYTAPEDMTIVISSGKTFTDGVVSEVVVGKIKEAENRLESKLGDLANLQTTDKTSAVAAINEVNSEVSQLDEEVTNLTSAPIAFSESDTFLTEFYANEGNVIIVDITAISGSFSLFVKGFSSDYVIINSVGKIEITALHNGYLQFWKRTSVGTIEGSLYLKSYLLEQIDSLDSKLSDLELGVAFIGDDNVLIGSVVRTDSSGVRKEEKFDIVAGTEYTVTSSSDSSTYAYVAFYDANNTEIGEHKAVSPGDSLTKVAPDNAVSLGIYSYNAINVDITTLGKIRLLKEEISKAKTGYIQSIQYSAIGQRFTIDVEDNGINVTPSGYADGYNLNNEQPFSAIFDSSVLAVRLDANNAVVAESYSTSAFGDRVLAIFRKIGNNIYNIFCAIGIDITSSTTKYISNYIHYTNTCVHAKPSDFAWNPLLYAITRIESEDTTLELKLAWLKRGGSNVSVDWNYRILLGLRLGDDTSTTYSVWCSEGNNDTYVGNGDVNGTRVRCIINKTIADMVCPTSDSSAWPWHSFSPTLSISLSPLGLFDTNKDMVTDVHRFPGYIESSESLYNEDSNNVQMIPMTNFIVNHETIGASLSVATNGGSIVRGLYGKVYNPSSTGGGGCRIEWRKVAFDGTNYNFAASYDSARYPKTIAASFLDAYRKKAKLCFRFSIYSGQTYDAYVLKPNSVPSSLATWVSDNGYHWNSNDILVDEDDNEVNIGCPTQVLIAMLEEGKPPVKYISTTGSGDGWYYDFTSDSLYDAFIELHRQFDAWLDTPMVDENGNQVTSTFYGNTISLKWRDVLSEIQFGLGVYSEGSIKYSPSYTPYPVEKLKRYYTAILNIFDNDMVFFGNAISYDISRYLTLEDALEIWSMSNSKGRVGLYLDAIGANVTTNSQKLSGIFPFSGEGYRASNYDIKNYMEIARFFNVHSYHFSNFVLPINNNGNDTVISATARRTLSIMWRLFGPHLWYEYLSGSTARGWVMFSMENIGLHYMFDTGRKLYLVIRNSNGDVVSLTDISDICNVYSLVPKAWDTVGIPTGQTKYKVEFTPIANCTMYLTLADPDGTREPFWFNNTGRTENGEYPLVGF